MGTPNGLGVWEMMLKKFNGIHFIGASDGTVYCIKLFERHICPLLKTLAIRNTLINIPRRKKMLKIRRNWLQTPSTSFDTFFITARSDLTNWEFLLKQLSVARPN